MGTNLNFSDIGDKTGKIKKEIKPLLGLWCFLTLLRTGLLDLTGSMTWYSGQQDLQCLSQYIHNSFVSNFFSCSLTSHMVTVHYSHTEYPCSELFRLALHHLTMDVWLLGFFMSVEISVRWMKNGNQYDRIM